MTGGGAVYHDLQNLNYTLIGAHPSPQPVVDALRSLGVAAELTGRNDIFVDGKKVTDKEVVMNDVDNILADLLSDRTGVEEQLNDFFGQ